MSALQAAAAAAAPLLPQLHQVQAGALLQVNKQGRARREGCWVRVRGC